MAKFFFKRILPSRDQLKTYRILKPIMSRLGSVAIWRVNRFSISSAAAIGAFFGALPLPIQMPMAALTACLMRVNLPCAVLFTLWSNPFTVVPIYYFNYRIGVWLLHMPAHSLNPESFSEDKLIAFSGRILMPLFSGSIIVGIIASALTYMVVYYWWRFTIVLYKRARKKRALQKRLEHK